MIDTVRQDLRFALRLFRRRPGFTLLTVLTLALGIGATTAAYTIVHAVLLRALPYRNPDELVVIWDNAARDRNLKAQMLATYADFEQYAAHAKLIGDLSAVGRTRPVLHYGGVATRRLAGVATVSTFSKTLGTEPFLGRSFVEEDQRGGCAVVLQHRFWTTTLGADPSLIGRSLALDQSSCTVLGVMPAGFTFFPDTAEMWFLMGHDSASAKKPPEVAMFARLRSGATPQQAQAELTALHSVLHKIDPSENKERDRAPEIDGLQREFTYLAGAELRTTLLMVFAAVSLVLLIACLNVANLLLARLSERQRELVVRAALGSGRLRLIQQVLTESLLLSLAGTSLGIGIAAACVWYFRIVSPIGLPPHAGVIGINLHVLLFAAFLSVATTLLFGLIPAKQVSRLDVGQSLKSAGRGFLGSVSRRRTTQMMLSVEMALSFMLLVGAGLLMTSVLRMGSEPLGFDPEGVFRIGVTLPMPRYAEVAQRTRFYENLLTRLENAPGVATVAFGQFPPFDGGGGGRLEIQDRPIPGTPVFDVYNGAISARYFELLKIPLLRGRTFEVRDRMNSPQVAIVSQAIVDEYFSDRDPLGQQIRFFYDDDRSPWMTIVGVVGTQKHMVNDSSWRDTPMVYRPLSQQSYPQISIGARSSGNAGSLGRELQRLVSTLDSSIQVDEGELLAVRLEKMLSYPRFRATLLACFALGALLLAAVGLHGVLAQLVSQRTPEFGVRRAAGAQTRHLLWLVARQGGVPVLAGLGVGLVCSLAFSRLLASLLYRIQPADPAMLGAVSLMLVVVSALAIALPARRAASVDPMVALRDE